MARADLLIRPGRIGDVAAIHAGLLAMARHIGGTMQVTATRDDLARHGFGPQAAFRAAIAEIDGRFAGMCLFFPIFSTWMGRPGIFIQDIHVEEGHRGAGVGEALLRHVARQARAKDGAAYLSLSVDAANSGARAFYERLGISQARDDLPYRIAGEAFEAFCNEGKPE